MMVIVSDSESVIIVVTCVFGVVRSSTVSPSTSIAGVVVSDSALTVIAASSSALVVSSMSSSGLAVVVILSIGIMVVTIVTPSSVSSIDKMVVVIGAPVVTSSPGAAKSTSSDKTEVSSETAPGVTVTSPPSSSVTTLSPSTGASLVSLLASVAVALSSVSPSD